MPEENIPIAPLNFNEVVRYQSNLPIDRVKYLHEKTKEYTTELENMMTGHKLPTIERLHSLAWELSGYAFELSQPNQ